MHVTPAPVVAAIPLTPRSHATVASNHSGSSADIQQLASAVCVHDQTPLAAGAVINTCTAGTMPDSQQPCSSIQQPTPPAHSQETPLAAGASACGYQRAHPRAGMPRIFIYL